MMNTHALGSGTCKTGYISESFVADSTKMDFTMHPGTDLVDISQKSLSVAQLGSEHMLRVAARNACAKTKDCKSFTVDTSRNGYSLYTSDCTDVDDNKNTKSYQMTLDRDSGIQNHVLAALREGR